MTDPAGRRASTGHAVEPAPAKLNLWLEVLGRLPDGRHALRSLAEPLAWGDLIEVTLTPLRAGRAPEVVCRCPGHPELEGPENLAARAAEALLQTGRTPFRCEVTVRKTLPVGAGLGGGSADAAAALRALARLCGPPGPSAESLAAMAGGLGADVPFCLRGEAALVTGWGEQLAPARLPDHGLCLLDPGVLLSTAEMFRRLGAPALEQGVGAGPAPLAWRPPQTLADLASEVAARGSAFSAVALEAAPRLGEAREALLATGPLAAGMSGSGSALFGLYPPGAGAAAAEAALREAGWRAVATAPAPPPARWAASPRAAGGR